MWLKFILFASLFILGHALFFNDIFNPPTHISGPSDKDCGEQKIDINFAFDSALMGTRGTADVTRFINTVISTDLLNSDKLQVGAITRSCPRVKEFHLYRFQTPRDISSHFSTYTTEMSSSLVTNLLMNAFERKNGGRKYARKIAVLFLKGRLNNPFVAIRQAESAKEMGIEIFVVDVGSLNHQIILESIASGNASHILRAVDSEEMVEIAYSLVRQIYKSCQTIRPTFTRSHMPTTTPPHIVFKLPSRSGNSPQEAKIIYRSTNSSHGACGEQEIDITFAFDAALMGTTGTAYVTRFIETVLSTDDLYTGKVQVGTITGACTDTKGFHLNRFKNLQDIRHHFSTYTTKMSTFLITDLLFEAFRPKYGGRKHARKIAVVFIKGKLSNPDMAIRQAKFAKQKGIEIFVVDVGNSNHPGVIESIASGNSAQILRAVDSDENITTAHLLVSRICKMTMKKDIAPMSFHTEAAKDLTMKAAIAPTFLSDAAVEDSCSDQVIDINFAFDSGLMEKQETAAIELFIETVIFADILNNDNVRVGAISKACPDTNGFFQKRFKNRHEVSKQFDSYRTEMSHLLFYDILYNTFGLENGARKNARKIAVIFIKGELKGIDMIMEATQQANEEGIEIFIVDMQSSTQQWILRCMVSGKKSHILKVDDSSKMTEKANLLIRQICKFN